MLASDNFISIYSALLTSNFICYLQQQARDEAAAYGDKSSSQGVEEEITTTRPAEAAGTEIPTPEKVWEKTHALVPHLNQFMMRVVVLCV